ncbi:NADH:flavin oxidoreductase/NADH oxidase [Lentinus tigrinus ALCF2SS1-7]|uniref:NADH:flavin oxidoreductase/NADH oxidase n=1 Tax=Lentinus tigrinus ALCF2SS1-6 TaxID=1328759 RepID=A0A5C2SGZ0_9APHY|nr:NADH:flavin oxidoreductase/NADH oxidase [Lentinus tigrinus ALCF2SS1-6]RPD77698.1 NADH:flavin oxidoreductase/NADH oxidase [Lentinus tigrinus ALCF2SS1-7]
MSSAAVPALFQPILVGNIKLLHRVILAPQTRLRNSAEHVPTDLGLEFYSQRASIPGTLLVTEATFIAPQASGMPHAPGIWNDEQVAGWKRITDAVHAKGSFIFSQLWALGRAARPDLLHKEYPDYPYVSSSPIPLSDRPQDVPRELAKHEIQDYVGWYATAAKNAIMAGFDGVEIHGANGYLIDQFLQDVSNKRTDAAVRSPTGRASRSSPWSRYQDMREDDPVPTFTYLVNKLKEKHPDLAYIHVVAPGAPGSEGPKDPSQVDFINGIWAPRPLITCGGYDRESGLRVAETGQIIGYARAYTANPDLPFRLRENIALNELDEGSLYIPLEAKGYTTYPFSKEFLQAQKK